MKRAAIYARVSTVDQDESAQVARAREFCDRMGYVVHVVAMERVSARDARRPEQERVMAAIRGRHVQVVVVAKLDRWMRSLKQMVQSVEELLGVGAEFHAMDQGLHIKPRDPTSGLIMVVLAGVAEWEGAMIRERTKQSLAHRKDLGLKNGRHFKGCGLKMECPTGAHTAKKPEMGRRVVLECTICGVVAVGPTGDMVDKMRSHARRAGHAWIWCPDGSGPTGWHRPTDKSYHAVKGVLGGQGEVAENAGP